MTKKTFSTVISSLLKVISQKDSFARESLSQTRHFLHKHLFFAKQILPVKYFSLQNKLLVKKNMRGHSRKNIFLQKKTFLQERITSQKKAFSHKQCLLRSNISLAKKRTFCKRPLHRVQTHHSL